VNCPAVRDLLAEHALGALPGRDADAIDRHVAWCAACRKEAAELHTAAAVLAFSVAPAEPGPAPDLEDRVVQTVQRAVQRRPAAHVPPRRGRLAVVAVVAAMLAVSGLGWGAVMAGRAARSDEAAQEQTRAAVNAAERFQRLLKTVEFADPEGEVYLATLGPTAEGGGGGSALTLVSPSIRDMAVVLVNGVPQAGRKAAPFTARLRGPGGVSLTVGKIRELDASGSGIVMRDFDVDLGAFDTVVVRDAARHVVMRGTISTRAPIASPTP
jgi:Putative zinc-finger